MRLPLLSSLVSVAACASFHTAVSDDAAVRDAGGAAHDAGARVPEDATHTTAPSVDARVVDARPTTDVRADAGPGMADASHPCTGSCGIVTMVSDLQEPIGIAVDDTFLYWIEAGVVGDAGADGYGELARVAKSTPCGAGCSFTVLDPTVLAGEGIYNSTMGLGPGNVCYAQTFDSPYQYSVNCISLKDGSEQNLAQSTGYAEGIWVGLQGAYWAVSGSLTGVADGVVTGVVFDGGKPETVASSRPGPWGITGSGGHVYWTETGLDGGPGQGTVLESEADGGALSLATAQASPQAIAVYGGYVYWANSGDGTVRRLAQTGSGGTVETVAANQPAPVAIVVDASGVYWANAGTPFQSDYTGGSVAHTSVAGGAVTVDLPNLTNAFGVAIDATFIYAVVAGTYAADFTDGKILRIGKS